MDAEQSPNDVALRQAVADVVTALQAKGESMRAIARAAGCDVSTISRWNKLEGNPTREQLQRLTGHYPDIDPEPLFERYDAARGRAVPARGSWVDVETLGSTPAVYASVVEALKVEPRHPEDRVLRHGAMHLDRRGGGNPAHTDALLDPSVPTLMREFADLLHQRAREGWKVRQLFALNSPERINTIRPLVEPMDGEDVEVRAITDVQLPILNPFVIGTRVTYLAYDHARWERPGGALVVHDRNTATWAAEYFDQLFYDADIKLVTGAGINEGGFAELERRLRPDEQPST